MEIITIDNKKIQKKGTELLEEKLVNMKSASQSASLCKLLVKKITSAKTNAPFKIGQQGFVVQKVKNGLFNTVTVVLSRNFILTFNKKNEIITISQNSNSATGEHSEQRYGVTGEHSEQRYGVTGEHSEQRYGVTGEAKYKVTFFLKKNIIKIKSNDFSFKKKCDLEQSLKFVLNHISKTGRLNFSITVERSTRYSLLPSNASHLQ